MTDVAGSCAPRFSGLHRAFESNLRSGDELGGSIYLAIDGEVVVDLWGGSMDAEGRRPWTSDTIVNVWSITKVVTAIAALMLVDRGQLELDATVGSYWPEFATNGKADITVRQILSHTSGVSGWSAPFAMGDMYDPERAAAALAAQAPWWEPGTASGYHAQNYGHLVGELVRRITGSTLRDFVDDEISAPLNADFHIGAREQDWPRVAEIVPPPRVPRTGPPTDRSSVAYRTFTGPLISAADANTPEWRRAELGAMNGHGNARSVGKVLTLMPHGQTFDEQTAGVDLVLGVPVRFGLGLALTPSAHLDYLPSGRVGFWGGWGGSLALIDVQRNVVFTYVMNRMDSGILGSPRTESYVRAAYGALT